MKIKSIILLFGVIVLLSACGATETEAPTVDINQIHTAAAETVVAELTQTAAANSPTPEPSATSVESPATGTAVPTSEQGTESPAVTESPAATATLNTEASPTGGVCDDAIFVADVSVQDGTEMSPGQQFEKTWRIRNTGTCTWGEDYRLVYGYGTEMNGQARALPEIVSPESTVEVTVVFTAPLDTGEYESYWRMANSLGANFGEFFFVSIVVR